MLIKLNLLTHSHYRTTLLLNCHHSSHSQKILHTAMNVNDQFCHGVLTTTPCLSVVIRQAQTLSEGIINNLRCRVSHREGRGLCLIAFVWVEPERRIGSSQLMNNVPARPHTTWIIEWREESWSEAVTNSLYGGSAKCVCVYIHHMHTHALRLWSER